MKRGPCRTNQHRPRNGVPKGSIKPKAENAKLWNTKFQSFYLCALSFKFMPLRPQNLLKPRISQYGKVLEVNHTVLTQISRYRERRSTAGK